ncbi:MAG: hypothetical protein ACTSSG_01865 [Candidatus Heimdallarchaeaceae archaeon]
MNENILERVFKIQFYIRKEAYNIRDQDFPRDPWTNEYIPELFISSEKLNSQIARLVEIVGKGKSICSVIGDIKSGKSYLLSLLNRGLKESLWKYSEYKKIHVLMFTSDDLPDYSQTKFLQKIAESVLGKYYQSKEEIIVELKKYLHENNALLVILLDNFKGNILLNISRDSARFLKTYKEQFSCIISCGLNELQIATKGIEEGGWEIFSYSIRVPELTLSEAKDLVFKRMCYGLNRTDIKVQEIFSDRAIEAAWAESRGNPWVLISILSNAYTYAIKNETKMISYDDVNDVISLFSRTPVHGDLEDHDRFIIQQALNNFPYRERQVCEYLMHKDATAKELTLFLYGELSSSEYRSKYMGTKSFLKRLKEKNVVVIKGQKGRSLLFGMSPKMKERLSQNFEDDSEAIDEKSFIYT